MSENKLHILWNKSLEIIKDNVSDKQYKTWFEPIVPLKYEDQVLTLGVPSSFFYEIFDANFPHLMRMVLDRVFGRGTQLRYQVTTDKQNNLTQTVEGSMPTTMGKEQKSSINENKAPTTEKIISDLDSHLIPNYRFENFLKGDSNEFSRTVAENVAQNPAKTFNPLFIYGPSGVGKTHLINAIGSRIKELYPQKRVLYISAHLFQVQYTDSVRTNHFNDFIAFYQTIDCLIIDDIQEIAGNTKTQNTFFHIFNHLHQNGKQLILSSDKAPVDMQGMEDRLLTRFKWGLIAELSKPDVELRRNILKKKVSKDGLLIPNEVIDFIAENVSESVRELEGIINSLLAQSILFKREIDVDFTKMVVKRVIKQVENKPLTIEEIVSKVCKHFGLDESVIFAKTRKKDVVQARQIAMYLAKKHTDQTISRIGKMIGNKDHATVIHSINQIKDILDINKPFEAELKKIESSLRRAI